MSTLFGFIIVICTIKRSLEEMPSTSCPNARPFKTMSYSCANFTEVCVKSEDKECSNFQNVCAQCPPSNFSTLTYLNMENVKEQLNNNEKRTNTIYILLLIIIVFNILMLALLILEIRFKIITKLICYKKRKNNNQYKFLSSRKLIIEEDLLNDINEIKRKVTSSECKMDLLLNQQNILMASTYSPKSKIKNKFRMNGKIIKIKIKEGDSCVAVKRKICNKFSLYKSDDYKMLKLKYKGVTLDDNQYFSSFDIPPTEEILCEKDITVNIHNILVVKLEGNIVMPEFIQVQKHQTIFSLKKSIPGIQDAKNCKLFIEDKNKKDRKQFITLDDKSIVASNRLIDDECIYIFLREVKELRILSIFNDGDSIVITYDNTDTVLSMKKNAANKLNCRPEDFVLIEKDTLVETAFAFEYNFSAPGSVRYCRIMGLDGIIIGESLKDGKFSDLFRAKIQMTNIDILIKKYFIKPKTNFIDNKEIIKEIITFQITRSHPRFVSLLGIYIDSSKEFLVALENMELGTLKSFIKEHQTDEKDIGKWAYQMLEGLKYLHDHEIIHRDLNPSSILIDISKNLKLSNFNLSKYKGLNKPSSIIVNDNKNSPMPIRYFAPEIIKSENCNFTADVWSFGAILIKIITKKAPFQGIKKDKIIEGFQKSTIFDYEFPQFESKELERIIKSCMKIVPEDRASVEELLDDNFIKQFHS